MTNLFGTRPTDNLNAAGTLVTEEIDVAAGQTVINLSLFSYTPNTGSLIVFLNGIKQRKTLDYAESSSTSFTFTSALALGDTVTAVGFPLVDILQAGIGSERTDLPTVGVVQDNGITWGGTSTGVDSIAITITPTPIALVAGAEYNFIAGASNLTSTPTLNVSGLGAKTITLASGAALGAGSIAAGALIKVIYTGTNFVFMNPSVTDATIQAWAVFDGTVVGTNAPNAGYNITSIQRYSTGKYKANFTNPMRSINYGMAGMANAVYNGSTMSIGNADHALGTHTVNACDFMVFQNDGGGSIADASWCNIIFYG